MRAIVLGLLALAGSASETSGAPAAALDASALIGTWSVDLRPTPEDPGYYQPFVVESVDGSTFTGTFYGSEITNAQLNLDKGAVWFAFTTEDGSGAYNTAGRLVEGRLEGSTHSLGRGFLLPWTAEREES